MVGLQHCAVEMTRRIDADGVDGTDGVDGRNGSDDAP